MATAPPRAPTPRAAPGAPGAPPPVQGTVRAAVTTANYVPPTDGPHHLLTSAERPPVLPWPDIGHLGKWSVSSFKFGFGPECLKDDNPDTFWHSDGPQPHFMTIQFPRKIAIQKISLLLRFPLDDSYTPSTLCIRAGTGLNDLQDVKIVTLDKPDGWITFDVSAEISEEGDAYKPIHAYVLQIVVIANHMNGKDTHVRGLHVLGPLEDNPPGDDPFSFVTPKFTMYQCIR